MYAYFIGEIAYLEDDAVILETNNIGYRILMPSAMILRLPSIGEMVKIYTYTCVREDAFLLFGFLSKDELNIFKLLITVSGIGPKGAMSILSAMDVNTLCISIVSQDVGLISKAPGIGAKTANRLILELKDKIKLDELISPDENKLNNNENIKILSIRDEASQALVSLGYSVTDAYQILRQVEITEHTKVEQVIKDALKKMI